MKSSKFWFCLAASLIVLASTHTAHADTYQIFNLGSDEARSIYALSSTGVVVIGFDTTSDTCLPQDPNCFTTWVDGVPSASNTPPPITSDEGTPCAPSVPGAQVFAAVCNNGRTVMSAQFPADSAAALYTGTDPADFLDNNAGTLLYLNSEGDMVWNNPRDEFWFEAIDESTSPVPEPGSLTLFATGLAATAGAIRRRLRS